MQTGNNTKEMELKKKLFSEKQMLVSTFFGGLIPPVVMIYMNLFRLGKENKAYISLAVTLTFSVLYILALSFLPENILDKIPVAAYNIFVTAIAYVFIQVFLKGYLKEAFDLGTKKASNWIVAGISLLGMIFTIALIMITSSFVPLYDAEKMDVMGNELYYDSATVSQEQIDILTEQLIEIDLFGEDYGNVAYIKNHENQIVITIPVDKQFWEEKDFIFMLSVTMHYLEIQYDKPTKIVLEHFDISGESEFKYLE